MKCPKCQTENPDTQSFCGDCGTQLGQPEEAPAFTKTLETPFPQLSPVISDNHPTRTTTNRIPVFFRGLVDYPGQGGLDGNGSTSEEINGISEEAKN